MKSLEDFSSERINFPFMLIDFYRRVQSGTSCIHSFRAILSSTFILPMMISKNGFIFLLSSIHLLPFIHCQITGEYDQLFSNELDYIAAKYIPSILHNENIYLTILYKCASARRISLSINLERTLYRQNFAVFRRHWFCERSTRIRIRYVKVRLHRSMAYASDIQSNLYSWPIEQGQLKLTMYASKQENTNEILKNIWYNVRFLLAHKRPNYRSFPWNPTVNTTAELTCPKEAEIIRVINYPLVLTGSAYGKHFVLPAYRDYYLRLEQQIRLTRPKFSIILWLYIDEYCSSESMTGYCAILQHLTFNNTHLTPEIFLHREGQITVNMYGNAYDLHGTSAHTFASIPKKDWCRLAFVVQEYTWNVYINCLRNWNQPIKAIQHSPIYYYLADESGTFIVGGSDLIPSFRGYIAQMDIYRRIAFTYEQLPKKFERILFPSIFRESEECKRYFHSFQQIREQVDLFNKRLEQKFSCSAQPFVSKKSHQQCPLTPTWKKQWLSSPTSTDVRYRIFRALRRGQINSTIDIANKLFNLTIKLLENDDFNASCNRIMPWSEQAACYGHPAAHSLLATAHQYGLCGLQANSTRALELLLAGALLNDRISLLALGHRHFYGLDGVPLDYDTAYVYYQQMASISRFEFYNPKPGEAAMEHIRLTDDKLLNELTFDKSDVFYWLTQQAKRGVAAAQYRLGILLHEGRDGLTRNVQAAVEYFRLGAAQHDASSHFGYGLALLKGQGIKQNLTEAIRQLQQAVQHGLLGAQVALGYHAYEIEKNYTKAAQYWEECYNRIHDTNCAHNLGVMWTAGHYPPNFVVDHVQAWKYYSFAAQHGQIDSKVVVAYYNARGGHPSLIRNPWLAASWSRFVAEESSAVGTIVRRALEAYRDRRWRTSFIFYLQAALSGIALGYFNTGYLCHELNQVNSFDCIEQFFNMYLIIHGDNIQTDPYALLTVAEYYRWETRNSTKAMQLYVQLYRNGDPQGLYNLALMEEESNINSTIPLHVWTQVGVHFDEKIVNNRYRRLQTIYQHCRELKTSKSDESYIPCTFAYLRISTMILLNEQSKILIAIILMIFTTFFFTIRR